MLEFLTYIFFCLGLMVAFIGIAYGVTCLMENIQTAAKNRNERQQRLIKALESIEVNTRNKPNQV